MKHIRKIEKKDEKGFKFIKGRKTAEYIFITALKCMSDEMFEIFYDGVSLGLLVQSHGKIKDDDMAKINYVGFEITPINEDKNIYFISINDKDKIMREIIFNDFQWC